jgi:hypothetical protein
MVWDKWGIRKEEYDRIKKYRRTKESEGLFNRTPSADTLFKANTDSQSWNSFSFTSGNFVPSPADIKAQLDEEQTGIGSCISNKQCPTGYACIDGKCVKIYTRDNTTWGTCGDERLDFPCKERGPKTTNECSTSRPGPGDCQDSDCGSGPKCCRQNADGSVSCYCGSCEDVESGVCSVYCDTTFKLFGTVSAGCSKSGGVGVCGGNICTECSECEVDVFGGAPKCQKYEQGNPSAPCWCNECNNPCERCQTDPSASNFNNCVFDATNCNTCCSVTNPECECGSLLALGGTISACTPYLGRPCMDVLYEKIGALCAEKCEKEPDPCAATGSDKYCVNGSAPIDPATNPEGPAGYTCPSGQVCEYTGFLEGGGKTCYLFKTWTLDEIPSKCVETGCNCNNDCGDCKICNGNGECESDPACANVIWDLWFRYNGDTKSGNANCGVDGDQPPGVWERHNPAVSAFTEDIARYGTETFTTYHQGLFQDPVLAPGANLCGIICPGSLTTEYLTLDGATHRFTGYADGCRRVSVGNNSLAYVGSFEYEWVLSGTGPPS